MHVSDMYMVTCPSHACQDDIIDDMVKLLAAAKCVEERGAYRIYVIATHGIFTDSACQLLAQSPITEVMKRCFVKDHKGSDCLLCFLCRL